MPTDEKSGVYTEGAAISTAEVNRARFQYTQEKAALALESQRWKNRRQMAWICLWAIMIVTTSMMFIVPETRIANLDEVVVWFYVSMASIIGVYIGSATMSDIKTFVKMRGGASASNTSTPYDAYESASSIADNPDGGNR